MKKKYYDAPQMEIVNIQVGQHLLDGSPVDELLRGNGGMDAGSSDASSFFDNGDNSENW
jgi:hypothetical protein